MKKDRRSLVWPEQRTLNPRVGGSNSSAGTRFGWVLFKLAFFMVTVDLLIYVVGC